MREQLLGPSPANPLLVWCLTTFQTAGLTLLLVTLIYLSGGLGDALDSLNTVLGLGLFGYLWLTNWWATRRAVAGLDLLDPEMPVARVDLGIRGGVWGAINGFLFFAALSGLITIEFSTDGTAGDESPVTSYVGLFLGLLVLGAPFAAIVGCGIGVSFATIDLLILEVARAIGRASGRGAGKPSS